MAQFVSTGGGLIDRTLWLHDGIGWLRSTDGELWSFSYPPEFYGVTLNPLK